MKLCIKILSWQEKLVSLWTVKYCIALILNGNLLCLFDKFVFLRIPLVGEGVGVIIALPKN